MTTIFVTHDQEEAMDVAEQIVVMNEGQIEQVGAPRELYEHPKTEFVMSFVGEVNRFGNALIRPHDLDLGLVKVDGAEEAMIERVSHLGFEVRVELSMASGDRAWAQVTRAEAEELELEQGQIIFARPSRAKVFENGEDPERPLPTSSRSPEPGARPSRAGRSAAVSAIELVAAALIVLAIVVCVIAVVVVTAADAGRIVAQRLARAGRGPRRPSGRADAPRGVPDATRDGSPASRRSPPGPPASDERPSGVSAGGRRRQCDSQTSGRPTISSTGSGSSPATMSASVTVSRTSRMFARRPTQTSWSFCARAEVLEVLGPLAADGRQRAVDGADDLGDGDLRGAGAPASSRPRRRAGSGRAPSGGARRGCSRGTGAGSPAPPRSGRP